MKCAICGSENVTPSHRKGMEKISRYVIPRAPYRCKECWSRFWVFENPFRNKAAKIAGGCFACLLITGLAWHFWPRREQNSWQAVQRNVGAVPESRQRESATAKSSSDLQNRTDQLKTEDTEEKPGRSPVTPMPVRENGKAEKLVTPDHSGTPATDSGVISITPKSVAVSDPVSASGDKQDTSPASCEKNEGEKKFPESKTKGDETAGPPEKKTETDNISQPVLPESAKPVTPSADAGLSAPGGSEAPHKIRAGYAGKTGASDAGSLQTGKAAVEPEPAPVSEPETKTVSDTVSFRELKSVKTESGKDAFEVHIMADGPVRHYKFFPLPSQSPPKLVVDLPGKWKHRGDAIFRVKDSMVSQVRVGQHPDFIRVVLDLKISTPVLPAFSETDQGLRVTIRQKAG